MRDNLKGQEVAAESPHQSQNIEGIKFYSQIWQEKDWQGQERMILCYVISKILKSIIGIHIFHHDIDEQIKRPGEGLQKGQKQQIQETIQGCHE